MYPYIKICRFSIPSYGICVCTAFFVCAMCVFVRARKMQIDLNDLLILFATCVGCGMVGGSALYILVTYDFKTIYQQIAAGNFLFFQKQGTVFYGGLMGSLLGVTFVAKALKIKLEALEACIVPYIPLGHAIGRIGCLLAGCCYGLPYQGALAVSTAFEAGNHTFFPIQVVEALANLLIAGVLSRYIKVKRKPYSVLCMYLLLYSCLRFTIEFFRGDAIRGKALSFSTSQWISLIVFASALTFFQKNLLKNKRPFARRG